MFSIHAKYLQTRCQELQNICENLMKSHNVTLGSLFWAVRQNSKEEHWLLMCLKLGHFPFFRAVCTWILLLFGFPTFEFQPGPNSFNVGQIFKLPILTGLSSVRWLAVDLWISEQEINGLNPPLWAKYYSSSSFRKKHLYL